MIIKNMLQSDMSEVRRRTVGGFVEMPIFLGDKC
jgi:hypothetical protein